LEFWVLGAREDLGEGQDRLNSRKMDPSSDSSHRLEGIAARLQSIQESEKEKKDVLGKSDFSFDLSFTSSYFPPSGL
jgi:hypothetical protein